MDFFLIYIHALALGKTFLGLLGALCFHTKWRQKWCQVEIRLLFCSCVKRLPAREEEGVPGVTLYTMKLKKKSSLLESSLPASAERTGKGWGTCWRDGDSSLIIFMSVIHWVHSVYQGINRAFKGMGTAEENTLLIYIFQHSCHMHKCYESSMCMEDAYCSCRDIIDFFKNSVSRKE